MTHCPASGSTNSYHITLPFGRVLVCGECSGVWEKKGESMCLPDHQDTGFRQTRDEIIANFEKDA